MLISFSQVVAELSVSQGELKLWIEQEWVLPEKSGNDFLFDESDVARVQLIAELRRDLDVNEEAVPVVLRLLDQVHGLRRALDELHTAIQELPAEAQQQLQERLGGSTDR